ncbi:MAG: STAS domain-containing protein [Rubrivivax sp.]
MKLPATATLEQAASLLAELGQDTEAVDASGLQSFDTSAVALLLEASRRAQARGARCVVHGAPAKLCELATIYGVDELLSFEEEAGSGAGVTT